MILGAEIGLLIFGLWSLIRGKVTVFGGRAVYGMPARLLGLLAMTPIPLAFLVGTLFVVASAPANPERFAEDNKWALIGIEGGIVVLLTILILVIGEKLAIDPADRRSRKRRGDEDGYENDGERPA